MNYKLLPLILLSTSVFAGGYEHSKQPSPLQLQLQGQEQKQFQTGPTISADTTYPKIAASAIAPAVSQNTDCPIVSPASKAGSVFFFSGSGTTGTSINGICVAVYLGETDIVRKIACSNNREYHDANPAACK